MKMDFWERVNEYKCRITLEIREFVGRLKIDQ